MAKPIQLGPVAVVAAIALVMSTTIGYALPLMQANASPSSGNNDAARVSTSPGLTLSEVIAAFGDATTREAKGLQNILTFTKAGGSPEAGQMTPNLRVDVPVKATPSQRQVSFQYFVEVGNDLTPSIKHCSDVRLHVFLDKKEVMVTDWFGYDGRSPSLPLQTDKITISKVSPGTHELGLIPEGRISGCNDEGYVLSWGGTVAVFK